MAEGGFTKEQLAMAKQLRANHASKGAYSTESHAAAGPKAGQSSSSSLSSSTAPPVRSPSASKAPAPAGSMLRASNGLVRPLPSKVPLSAPAASAHRPAKPVAATHKLPPHMLVPKPGAPPLAPSAPSAPQAPAPVQPAPAPKQAAVQPAAEPAPKTVRAPVAAAPLDLAPKNAAARAVVPGSPNKAPAVNLLSAGSLREIAIPTMVPAPAANCPEVRMLGADAVPESQPAPVPPSGAALGAAKTGTPAVLPHAAPGVLEAIKINQMGKPVIWNYMTEAPAVRQVSQEEMEERKPLPPPTRLPWIRAWHPDRPLRAGPNGEIIKGDARPKTPPGPVLGLKASRHAG